MSPFGLLAIVLFTIFVFGSRSDLDVRGELWRTHHGSNFFLFPRVVYTTRPPIRSAVDTYGHLSLKMCSGRRYGASMFLSSITWRQNRSSKLSIMNHFEV